MNKKTLKPIPKFTNEDEEKAFWSTHSSVDYFDTSRPIKATFPNLKSSIKTVSLRLSATMVSDLKSLAQKQHISYQSLIKLFLVEKIKENIFATQSR